MPKKYIIDTQILLWLNGQKGSKLKASQASELKSSKLYVSVASYWEIAIKCRISKLDINMSIDAFIEKNEKKGIKTINITGKHLKQLEQLKKVQGHNDPFDHLIIATAIAEKINLKSYDKMIPEYFKPTII